jgi:hypothetical protein
MVTPEKCKYGKQDITDTIVMMISEILFQNRSFAAA